MKRILLLAGLVFLISPACKDKKSAPLKEGTPEVVVNTPKEVPVQEQEPIAPPVVARPDKYFLVAGSFLKQENAERCKSDWTQKGYQSQVVTRSPGVNSDFFRVSYMSFPDRKEAINAMEQERAMEGKEQVWVLVKN
jgi:cell division protein FtsN